MELTQEQINNLGFNYNCCISKKGEQLAKDISRGKECKCKSRKLVFLSSLVDIVNCYKLDQTIEHKPAVTALPTTWSRGLVITPGDTVTIFGLVDGVSTELGSGTTVELLCADINANTGTTGWAATWDAGTPLFYLITSPDGLYNEETLIEVAEPSGVPIPGTATTYAAGRDAIDAITTEYTTEELNCLTEDELQNIIEYINKECDCCI